MSQHAQQSVAGSLPAERSEAGSDPARPFNEANPAPQVPQRNVSPAPPAPADGDDTSLPSDPRPFGGGPGLSGRRRREGEAPEDEAAEGAPSEGQPPVPANAGPGSPRRGRRLVAPGQAASATRSLTAEQRLLVLDAWQRSGLSATDFAPIVGASKHALYAWKRRFAELGPAGLVDGATTRGATGSKLPEATRRAIAMLKKANPEWGCQRISDVLYRGPGLPASAGAVARVLKEEGYRLEESPTRPHEAPAHRFERAAPNQLWQTDLFTFVLKRQNRRLYLVAFMDDHSRYVVGYGLHATQGAALVLEVFRAAAASCGAPQEVLTDNGAQYVTWRGTSRFARELQQRGVRHIVASPRKPRTLGKIERFWGTLWRECLETAIFVDLEDARRRIGLFIDHYNFQRPHQGISEGRGAQALAPADRFFGAAPQTLAAMRARVAANALSLAREGVPREPFYISGQVGGKPFSLHAEGERIVMIGEDGARREVDLRRPDVPAEVRAAAEASSRAEGESSAGGSSAEAPVARGLPAALCAEGVVTTELDDEEEPAPGTSPLDGALRQVESALAPATTPDATPDASRDAPPHAPPEAPLPGGPSASDVPGHDAANNFAAGDAPTAREGGQP